MKSQMWTFATFRNSDFGKAKKDADLLWYYCRQFQDDGDIRGREPDYDKRQRETVEWHLGEYLRALGEVS